MLSHIFENNKSGWRSLASSLLFIFISISKCVDTIYNFYGYMPLRAATFFAAPLTGETSHENYKRDPSADDARGEGMREDDEEGNKEE